MPLNTLVTVINQPLKVAVKNDEIYLEAHQENGVNLRDRRKSNFLKNSDTKNLFQKFSALIFLEFVRFLPCFDSQF